MEVVEANSTGGSSISVLEDFASSYAGYAVGRTQTEGYWFLRKPEAISLLVEAVAKLLSFAED